MHNKQPQSAFAPRRILLSVTVLCALACRPAILAIGPSFDAAKRQADGLFAAFAFRFYNVQRDAVWATARPKFAKYALVPSRLFADSAVWTLHPTGDSVRALFLSAAYGDGKYLFQMRAAAPPPVPARVGDQRHFMQLTSRGHNDYAWYTSVEHNVGAARPADIARGIAALFVAFDGRTSAALLTDTRVAFSRTTRHLGQLIGIDTVSTAANSDGSTSARFVFRFRPDSLRRRYPAFAAYLDKYVVPSTYELQLSDSRGARYFHAVGRDGTLTVRLRAHNGSLVSLEGPLQPLPDSLILRMDFSARFKMFRVGFTGLEGDFVTQQGDHQQSWEMRFRKEPEWQLPLAVDRLIRAPLRRPFEGRGTELVLGVRDDLGAQTMSVRYARTVVNESAIMRWLGSLGAAAFSDFAEKSELEENRFLTELFTMLRADLPSLTPNP